MFTYQIKFWEVIQITRADRFLAAFNRIEKHLRMQAGDKTLRFSDLLKQAKGNAIIRRYKVDLQELADLRNAITHERTDPSLIIAEPHEITVQRAEEIASLIKSPPLVYPRFNIRVIKVRLDDPISRPLNLIKENNISQFPCYDDGHSFCGLLTERCIARWLSYQLEDDILELSETTVGEVIAYRETEKNVLFIPKNTNIFEMQERFLQNPLVEAILITDNGGQSEMPIGIVTLWDIAGLEL